MTVLSCRNVRATFTFNITKTRDFIQRQSSTLSPWPAELSKAEIRFKFWGLRDILFHSVFFAEQLLFVNLVAEWTQLKIIYDNKMKNIFEMWYNFRAGKHCTTCKSWLTVLTYPRWRRTLARLTLTGFKLSIRSS